MRTNTSNFWNRRTAGVLAHITSLPSPYGVGDLGREAHNYIDWLNAAGFTFWQVLPMGPNGSGNSPYCSWSAFCGNPMLIDLEWLVNVGLLDARDMKAPALPATRTDFAAVHAFKQPLIHAAARNLLDNKKHSLHDGFQKFKANAQGWLPDAALFLALCEEHNQKPWWEWEKDLRNFQPQAIQAARKRLEAHVELEMAVQFFFSTQIADLRRHAHHKGIKLLGDVAIYVDLDSADVWANQQLFQLGEDYLPTVVAGVPPDDFSTTGQLWGNPIYNWGNLAKTNYSWWVKRITRAFEMTDAVRIDHFRGLAAYWEVPRHIHDARGGHWVPGPGHNFLDTIMRALPDGPLLAEDLGVIDYHVEKLRDDFALPGMLVLQFAFDEKPNNPFLPHNHTRNRVLYSGTHDNDTTLGWWRSLSPSVKDRVHEYLGAPASDHEFLRTMQRTAMSSVANTAIISMQDVLALGSEARMNQPGALLDSNWAWRFEWKDVNADLTQHYRRVLQRFQRTA